MQIQNFSHWKSDRATVNSHIKVWKTSLKVWQQITLHYLVKYVNIRIDRLNNLADFRAGRMVIPDCVKVCGVVASVTIDLQFESHSLSCINSGACKKELWPVPLNRYKELFP